MHNIQTIEAGDVVERTGCDTDSTRTGHIYTVNSVEGVKLTLVNINYPSSGEPVKFNKRFFKVRVKASKGVVGKEVRCTSPASNNKGRVVRGQSYFVEFGTQGLYKLQGVKSLWCSSRFTTISEKVTTVTQTTRKFWMIASDTTGSHYSHAKYRQFGGAPYKKYYSKAAAESDIDDMVNSQGTSYFLLEAVEHSAPAQAPVIKTKV
jgi:hypothetical protein